ncbi:hypothetical protein BIFANG_03656 [Bifidobacterium angulatum DSM 20098 = JCM 7096]|uniref:Uncharacterized protein n=1 Tax=Bifidobacterium angulatum DSM 20098 = JCM 7096 TaxID=518635 RepID=C4FH25_9BIFI|nr:hypothetical protein BIFANG_03656 [Bifidobacterium angulatum DSM 20098 = JCM 7096]BAQ95852.1 hypothetical protein BBAG_0230 [Bifidobacterium angulatum DSM 20098 = JCM 7096]
MLRRPAHRTDAIHVPRPRPFRTRQNISAVFGALHNVSQPTQA